LGQYIHNLKYQHHVWKEKFRLGIAGIAAYAWYKYSQLSEDEKRDITNNIKEKGKKILDL
jgi:hypothetical protein